MTDKTHAHTHPWQIFLIFLRLGLTSFGGPAAHIAYFRDEFVVRRRWLNEQGYADLVALCQFLPGPASSQVGLALGMSQNGYRGAFAAWCGFTLPSAIALIIFALGVTTYSDVLHQGILQGLKVVAVAVVAQAVWGMARTLCTDTQRITLMALACSAALLAPSAWIQVLILALAGLGGLFLFKGETDKQHTPLQIPISRRAGVMHLLAFFSLLLALPLLALLLPNPSLAIVDAFYRAGSLVFGGGHVVLPLLQSEVVTPGWIDKDAFLAGYGAAQAVPGPLFTFAAFLGTAMNQAPNGWLGGGIALLAIFAPSYLLIAGALPFWEQLRSHKHTRAALAGVNAAVVGLLLAALYQPVWTGAIGRAEDFVLGLLALIALMFWKLPPWLVVVACAFIGWLSAIAL